MKWHIPSMGRVYDPGEETAIYFDAASGNTHLISDFAAYLIELIGEDSISTEDIVRNAASAVDANDLDSLDKAVSSALQFLAELEIIQHN
jgi:PqqD family protein of HPr-rel-A system